MKLVFRVAYATVVGESLWLELRAGAEEVLTEELLPMRLKDAVLFTSTR